MKGEDTDRAQFITRAESGLDRAQYLGLVNAYQLSKMVHREQYRKTGERYVTHPRAVAEILMDFGPATYEEIVTALVHDTVEDGYVLPEMLRLLFGYRIAEGAMKLTKYRVTLGEHGCIKKVHIPNGEYFQWLGCAQKFIRRVKLADRLHNLRTMLSLKPESKRKKLDETYQYIIPLAQWTDGRLKRAIQEQCKVIEASIA